MGLKTKIEWCDSTLNMQEGCDGCELWKAGDGGTCYAGTMISRWGAHNDGHPDRFDMPEIYPHRLLPALGWPDLRGKARSDKPWLDGMPRCIFLDDMGDTFTEKLDRPEYLELLSEKARNVSRPHVDMYEDALAAVKRGDHWLTPFVEQMSLSPVIWMVLTKRPQRMARFFEQFGGVPKNFWPMTSITSKATLPRAKTLANIPGARVRGVSFEPIRSDVDFGSLLGGDKVNWIIAGGESGIGDDVSICDLSSVRDVAWQCAEVGVPLFVKQLGRQCRMGRDDAANAIRLGAHYDPETLTVGVVTFRDPKGGDPAEWPEDVRIRQMPAWAGEQRTIGGT